MSDSKKIDDGGPAFPGALRLVIEYDDLLRTFTGPVEAITASENAAIDAAYDKMVAAARSVDANNANLSDAAPDLLEAAAELVEQWKAFEASSGNMEEAYYKLAKYARPSWEKAIAAIAKAGG